MSNEIEFALSEIIIMTSTRLRAIANRFVFRESGITGSQFRILRLLAAKNKQNPTELLKFISGTKSNLSQRIKSLEKLNFISRSTNPEGSDRRNIQIELTPEGRELVAGLMRKFKRAARSLEGQFKKKEIEVQFAFFKKLNKLLDENERKAEKIFQN